MLPGADAIRCRASDDGLARCRAALPREGKAEVSVGSAQKALQAVGDELEEEDRDERREVDHTEAGHDPLTVLRGRCCRVGGIRRWTR